ncbi:hypothetical protein H920_10957 [Fukomys damarensis]|uniref:Uncharacterized protein n=1 Tax=Fukomys damarensis TaxID=885580 RepID=A0A091DBV2_FUKDA|nr:hypothetical protein H920_10957 [Fukomys damarensis]
MATIQMQLYPRLRWWVEAANRPPSSVLDVSGVQVSGSLLDSVPAVADPVPSVSHTRLAWLLTLEFETPTSLSSPSLNFLGGCVAAQSLWQDDTRNPGIELLCSCSGLSPKYFSPNGSNDEIRSNVSGTALNFHLNSSLAEGATFRVRYHAVFAVSLCLSLEPPSLSGPTLHRWRQLPLQELRQAFRTAPFRSLHCSPSLQLRCSQSSCQLLPDDAWSFISSLLFTKLLF